MDKVFLQILNLSISASYVILAVIVLRLVLKKAPKAIVCALWVLVGLRLALPLSIESVTSLIPSSQTISPDIVYASEPTISSGVEIIDEVVNPVISQSLAPATVNSVNPVQILGFVLSSIWLMGTVLMLGYSAFSYIRLRLKVREAVLVEKGVRQGTMVDSPFVLGLIRPRIYLPSNISETDKAMVLAHERAHIRRGDNWIKPAGFLLLAVHWFNPLVWLAYILLCRDIELACDERVLKEQGAAIKKEYSTALLNCSCNRRVISACPLAFGEVGVKTRIKSVLNYKKPAFWLILIAVLCCVIFAFCFMTNPVKGTQGFSPVGEWSDPVSSKAYTQVIFNSDGTANAYNARGDVSYTVAGDTVTLNYADEPLSYQYEVRDGVDHLINAAEDLDLVRSEDQTCQFIKLDKDNWQEYFQLVRRPWWQTNSQGDLEAIGYDIMLVPTEQYLQRLIPTDDNTVILSPGIKFNSVTTQMLSMDSQATTISVQETANGGSYSYSPAEPLTQSQLVKNVLGGESGLVLIRESAEYSKAQDAWILDYLEEPVIEDFSGDFMVFDKALLPQLASNSNLYAIDTSAQQLFEAVTSSEASGSSTIEGESYSPITNGVIGGSQGSGYDASLNFVIPLEGEGRDYAPASLSEVEGKYVDSRAAAALQQMLNDCRAAGNQVAIFRAYEEWIDPDISDSDFDSVNSSYKHVLQSGLCVLFARYENGDNYQVESMNDEIAQWDKAVTWLKEHCADYGFVQRWSWDKQDIQGISTVRPGMFRYVGVDAAKYMTANDLVLEEYVAENGGAVDKVTTPYVVSNS